jgi:hypothetical protein
LKNDCLLIEIESEVDFDIEDYADLMEAAKKLGKGRKFFNLIKIGPNTYPTIKAWKKSASEEGALFKLADAFVVSSLPQYFLSNLMLNIQKPAVPTKFFQNSAKAQKWLKNMQEELATT